VISPSQLLAAAISVNRLAKRLPGRRSGAAALARVAEQPREDRRVSKRHLVRPVAYQVRELWHGRPRCVAIAPVPQLARVPGVLARAYQCRLNCFDHKIASVNGYNRIISRMHDANARSHCEPLGDPLFVPLSSISAHNQDGGEKLRLLCGVVPLRKRTTSKGTDFKSHRGRSRSGD